MRLSNRIKNAITLVASLLMCAPLGEVGLRVYSAFFFPKMMVLDDKLGWRHERSVSKVFVNEQGKKSLVVQNTHGHRGWDYGFEKPQGGKRRILVLGDSFTEAVQVSEEELFTARLEQTGSNLQVINAGVGGYGTVQHYLYLVSEGFRFSPDQVVLMFFENDLSDNCLSYYPGFGPRPYATIRDGEVHIVEEPDRSQYRKFAMSAPFQSFLNKHSYLYYFLNSRIYQRLFSEQMRQLQRADLKALDNSLKYAVFFGIVDRMHKYLISKQIDFAMVLIPTSEDVARGHWPAEGGIVEFCQKNRIKCLSLLERFTKEESKGTHLYFERDIHWTREGHRIAADEITTLLKEKEAKTQHSEVSALPRTQQ